MSNPDIINDTIAPFVQRILSDPLHFRPAKQSDKVAHTPVAYIKIATSKASRDSQKTPQKSVVDQKKEEKNMIPKITSLAQALAGYTNKRSLDDQQGNGKKSKKAKKAVSPEPVVRIPNVADEGEGDDIGEDIVLNDEDEDEESEAEDMQATPSNLSSSSDEDDDSNYQDADDQAAPHNIVSAKVFKQFESNCPTSDSNNDDNDPEEDDDDKDEEFDAAEDEDEDASSESSRNDTDSEDVGETLDSCKVETRSDDEDSEDLELLKRDLLNDQRVQLTQSVTPPTSPESEDEKDPTPQPQSKLDTYYLLNENKNDRGSNGSMRIIKSWGDSECKLRPLGLLNHGVTCYTNAAVQAMVHIPAVQHYLYDILNNKYKGTINPRSVSHVLAETSARMWIPEKNKNSKYVNPKKLIGKLDEINCMMSEWQQEDSHEYFMSLLSRLQEDSTPKGCKLNESIIYDIFGGLLNQSVTCKSCGHISKTQQEFYDLSLHLGNSRKNSTSDQQQPLPKEEEESTKHRYSIQKSIKDFFSPELIKTDKSDKSGYVCENCEKRTNAIKISSISRAPETLTVHLKRFRFNGSSSSKVKQGVSYPAMLDLSQYTTEGDNVLYQLISVVVHEGRSVSSGHYIAHCRQPDGSWATYDDEYVNSITEKQALRDPSAYYLIYTRLTSKEHKFKAIIEGELPQHSIAAPSKLNGASNKGSSTTGSSSDHKASNIPVVKPKSPSGGFIKRPLKGKKIPLAGHQPTNNLNNLAGTRAKNLKKYTKKPKGPGGRFKKYT